jgi:tRNA nucleotidyltransferase (CCA-adding enzyme)
MPMPADLVQTEPGLAVLRMAALMAEDDGALDEDLLDAMAEHTARGALRAAPAAAMWPELRRGLMARGPSRMLAALRLSGALGAVLPEVAALFGVPQLGADQRSVDIGLHTLNALADASRVDAPLEVRFALLVMNVGKSDSPPEHLPVHYRHIERGGPRIEAICGRFGVPATCRDLALLALSECERVHRVSEVRAGPVAAMLARLGAFDAPERFAALMQVCACDYRAHGEGFGPIYPKAELLQAALHACREVRRDSGDLELARATAIATAFRSQRWSAAGHV